MKIHFKQFFQCCVLIGMITLCSFNTYAQQITVKGIVLDSNSEPLIGASIVQSKTTIGVLSDVDGKFELSNVRANGTLEISYIGYQSQTIKVSSREWIEIRLDENPKLIGEVVVVGYGVQKKETLSGAISTIGGEDVVKTKASSIAQSLQGKIAGVQIRQENGQPGSFGSKINIRGLGEPLYVIDGVVRDNGSGSGEFQRLSSDDIESISVLKDGAAAIYGMNAGSGVIIVTTKRGVKGKPKIKYNGSVSAVFATSKLKVMNAAQYMEVMNDFSMNNGTGPYTTAEELAKWRAGGNGYESTDWMGAVLKKSAVNTQHSLSAEGGNDQVSYYTSFGYLSDGDLTRGGDFSYEQYTSRVNLTAKLSKYITTTFNVSGRYDKTSAPMAGIFDLMFKSTISLPTSPIYANNNPEYLNYASPFNDNPVAKMNGGLTGMEKSRGRSFLSTASIQYDAPWVKGLSAKVMASYDANDSRATHERKKFNLYSYDSVSEAYTAYTPVSVSTLNLAMNNSNRLNLQTSINYQKTIDTVHNLSVMGMYEATRNWYDSGGAYREFSIYSKPIIDQGSQSNMSNSGSYGENANLSWLGRLNYDYAGKYLIEGAFRYNGSYRYASDKRWGFFPVMSGGWRLSEESFIKDNLDLVTNLKLRASYGSTGIDAGNEFQHIEGFALSNVGYELNDGVLTNSLGMPGLTNKKLTWMKSKTIDVGFDLTLWNGLLDFTFDLYQRDLTGIPDYPNVKITNTFGTGLPQENLNAERTQGVEFTVGHSNKVGEVKYSVEGNFNFARTKTIKKVHGDYSSSWDRWKNEKEGRWNGVGWGYETSGQFTETGQIHNAPVQTGNKGNTQVYPGDYYLRDVNGDGYIDGNDKHPMYYSLGMPAINFGVVFNVAWRDFDLYMLFQGATKYSLEIPDNLRNYAPFDGNSSAYLFDRWHRENPFDLNSAWVAGKNPTPRHTNFTPMGNNEQTTDRNTVNGSYLRLKTIELGYTLPKRWTQVAGIENLRVYMNAYNILSFYNSFLKNKLKVDPEKNLGQDNRMMNYPLSKTVNFGVNISF